MKIRSLFAVGVFVVAVGWGAGSSFAVETTMMADKSPLMFEVAPGGNTETLAAYTYPNFVSGVCAALAAKSMSPMLAAQPTAFFSDLVKDIEIPESYRNTGSILVTWTVRVEGESVGLDPRYVGCPGWWGTSVQAFPGGVVSTQLYAAAYGANNRLGVAKTMGNAVEMTIPDGATVSVTVPKPPPPRRDPTITGSYVIQPKDFGGTLPGKIKVSVKWSNATSMKVISAGGFRNMVITVMPTGGVKE